MEVVDPSFNTGSKMLDKLRSTPLTDIGVIVAELWERDGWTAEIEEKIDEGVVIIYLTNSSEETQKRIIQVTRESNQESISTIAIENIETIREQSAYQIEKEICVTTESFTEEAEERANSLNIELVDGTKLAYLIEKRDARDLIAEHGTNKIEVDLSKDTEKLLENRIGSNYKDYVRDQIYFAKQTIDDANGIVKINPNDAKRLGILSEIKSSDPESVIQGENVLNAVTSDKVYFTEDCEIIVEDLSDYVNSVAIDTSANKNIVGQIEPGVPNFAWTRPLYAAKLVAKISMWSAGSASQDSLSDTVLTESKTDSEDSTSKTPSTTETSNETVSNEDDATAKNDQKPNLSKGISDTDDGLIVSFVKSRGYFHYVALSGLMVSILSFFLIGTLASDGPSTSPLVAFFVLLFLIMPFVGLSGLLLDLVYINTHNSDWNPSVWLGMLGAIIVWPTYVIYYIYKRKKHIGIWQ